MSRNIFSPLLFARRSFLPAVRRQIPSPTMAFVVEPMAPCYVSSVDYSALVFVRSYHSSPINPLPVRRRRRSIGKTGPSFTGDDEDDDSEGDGLRGRSPLKHAAIDDDVEFVQAANTLLDKLEKGLEPMKPPTNDIFEVKRFMGDMGEVLTIDLGPKEGKYRIEMSLEDHVFEYSSPISGKILYLLSAQTGEWVGMEDGHAFEGLLMRDLIRQCRGLPKL